MARSARLALVALLLAVAGCSTTVFESLPAGSTTDCDPAWPGHWQPQATEPGETQQPGSVEISADCRTATTKSEAKPLRLTLVDTGKARYLQLHNDSGKPDCIGDDKAHCGAVLLRYEREGDTIRLYDADHAKVAAAIKAGRIEGFSAPQDRELKTSEPVFRNFVSGDARRIGKLLHRHPEYFAGEPLMVLRRVRADAAPAVQPTPSPGEAH